MNKRILYVTLVASVAGCVSGPNVLMPMALACSGLELAPTTRKAYGQSC